MVRTRQERAPVRVPGPCGGEDHDEEMGFGLAGGGYGAYCYCKKCGAMLWKTQEQDVQP